MLEELEKNLKLDADGIAGSVLEICHHTGSNRMPILNMYT